MTLNITDESFDAEVKNSSLPVLVDFWAEWCGPCKMLAPVIDELSKNLEDKIKITKMNVDENPNIPSNLAIRSIPTMMIFIKGEMVASKVGVLPKNSIEEWINSVLTPQT